MTLRLKIDSTQSLKEGVSIGAETILGGGVVALPTESFYGLSVDATNAQAVDKIFAIKKRGPKLPILILISSVGELAKYVIAVPPAAKQLAKRFWPGGLTMIFESAPILPSNLTGGTGKIGIRISSHPVARAIQKALAVPITGTSANISGTPPCTTADQVLECLGTEVDLVLDGGPTHGKNPSTVLDVTVDPPLILREGMIRAEEIMSTALYERPAIKG
ncbi:MAG: threonylcarbamoyl-AMP synthase [Deltaproteobacteria bacterium]|nr:MAG: threonylcarbamoyl-AMP synthase [Deltaproteobacteria bacterium]